ncbi:MAG: hypothetical protein NWP69_12505 [Congregibacter sp.]|nr:hypothetical protein [Congregibacter sp.]
MTKYTKAPRVKLSVEQDAEIGSDMFLALHRLAERTAKRHGIGLEQAADFLLSGSLFAAAHIYGLTIDQTVEVAQDLAESVQTDELEPEIRH